jgi:hypothetical protein
MGTQLPFERVIQEEDFGWSTSMRSGGQGNAIEQQTGK